MSISGLAPVQHGMGHVNLNLHQHVSALPAKEEILQAMKDQPVSTLIADLEEVPDYVAGDDPLKVLGMLLDYYLTTGADALARYDLVMRSCLYALASWQAVFSLVWMIYGTDMVFNTTWDQCHTAGLIVLRIRVLLFLIFVVPAFLNLIFFLVSRFLASSKFRMGLIASADSVDEFLGIGLPLAGIFIQAYLVRNRHDMISLQLHRYELQKMDLQLKHQKAEAKLHEVTIASEMADDQIERLEGRRVSEYRMTEEEVREREQAAKAAVLHSAEEVMRKDMRPYEVSGCGRWHKWLVLHSVPRRRMCLKQEGQRRVLVQRQVHHHPGRHCWYNRHQQDRHPSREFWCERMSMLQVNDRTNSLLPRKRSNRMTERRRSRRMRMRMRKRMMRG